MRPERERDQIVRDLMNQGRDFGVWSETGAVGGGEGSSDEIEGCEMICIFKGHLDTQT